MSPRGTKGEQYRTSDEIIVFCGTSGKTFAQASAHFGQTKAQRLLKLCMIGFLRREMRLGRWAYFDIGYRLTRGDKPPIPVMEYKFRKGENRGAVDAPVTIKRPSPIEWAATPAVIPDGLRIEQCPGFPGDRRFLVEGPVPRIVTSIERQRAGLDKGLS